MEDLSEKLAQMRRDYVSQPLTEDTVAADPLVQFENWFEETLAAQQADPEAMTLSTVAKDGRVSARIVLLKGCDPRGFVFYTNYESRKGRELAAQPMAALTFYWPALNRQVRVEGRVEQVTREETESYFATRPLGSRIGAWASPQSQVLESRVWLESRVSEMTARFGQEAVPCPPFWGGYLLRPDVIEFWQGRESRLHDRIVYALEDGVWRLTRLAP